MKAFRLTTVTFALIAAVCVSGCTTADPDAGNEGGELSGKIEIDGSSTVLPISEAVVEQFNKEHKKVVIPVAKSGTSGGFKKFLRGETDINDASRPIKDSEKEAAKEADIEITEFRIAKDGISVVVNKENDWVETMTVADLKKIWEPNSSVKTWKDINPKWPDEEIKLYGPDSDSGTFEFFTEAINGKKGAIRDDYSPSSDDNTLVTGVSGTKGGLGYFGYAYYAANKDKLKIVPIKVDDSAEAITPDPETIRTGTYKPLSRPLFIYLNNASLKRPEVVAFMKFYLDKGPELIEDVGYVGIPEEDVKKAKADLDAAIKSVSEDSQEADEE